MVLTRRQRNAEQAVSQNQSAVRQAVGVEETDRLNSKNTRPSTSQAATKATRSLKRKLTAIETDDGRVDVFVGVDATIQRGTASPSASFQSVDEAVADVTGYFGLLPREIIEQILGYLEPKELAMMDMTCRYFTESGITDQVARHHLKSVARAKGLSPMTERGETSLMLLEFVQGQSAAAAQGTAVAMGTYHTMTLMSEELVEDGFGGAVVPTGVNNCLESALGATSSTAMTTSSSLSSVLPSYGIYSFGRGFHGQLGTGGHASSNLPSRIKKVEKNGNIINLEDGDGKDIRLAVVHAGSSHSLAISRRGELFTWGLSSSGELGHGTWMQTEVSVPKLVTSFGKTRIVSVCAGSNHTLAISEIGKLWSCGRNRYVCCEVR